MPTAPLYYQPLVQAAIQSVPLGSSTLGAVARQQGSFAFIAPAPGAERQIHPVTEAALAIATDPALKVGVEKSMTGIAGLTDARRGARLDGINLNLTDEGYIASRTLMTIRDNPMRLDMASPDEAAAMAQNIMQQVARSGTQRPVIQGGVLDRSPRPDRGWVSRCRLHWPPGRALLVLLQRRWDSVTIRPRSNRSSRRGVLRLNSSIHQQPRCTHCWAWPDSIRRLRNIAPQ